MNFAWPWSFLLAVPLGIAAWRMLRRGRHAGIKFSAVGRLPTKTVGWRAYLANLAPWIFLAAALIFLVLVFVRRLGLHVPWSFTRKKPQPKPVHPATSTATPTSSQPQPTLPTPSAPAQSSTASALAQAKRRANGKMGNIQ